MTPSHSHRNAKRCRLACIIGIACLGLVACTSSPLGRTQLMLFPDAVLEQESALMFSTMKETTPLSKNARIVAQANCIVDSIYDANKDALSYHNWNVAVFAGDDVNAFAMPGGKIGVYEGLLDVAVNQHQLAAVIGHEIAHVEARHGNERMSTEFMAGAALDAVAAASSGGSSSALMAALGMGVQVGILLPYSRDHETEADLLGIDYMARAGFDPRESVALWHNMAALPGPKVPNMLSTHPSSDQRIEDLSNRMEHARDIHREALSQGRLPLCAL